MKFTVNHVFSCDVPTYWEKIFFEPEYNRRLYLEALGFKKFEVLELRGNPGEDRFRKLRMAPKSDAPAVVQKLIGADIEYTEEGRWDAKSGIWTFAISTSKLTDSIKISGRFWVEKRGEKATERFCETDLKVSIFGVGGAVEKFIESTTRESYEKTFAFTQKWIADHGL